MSTPKIAFHGGLCCGIKIIHSLGEYPLSKAEELFEVEGKDKDLNPDQWGNQVSSTQNFFHIAAPEEPYVERVDRYIKFLHDERPYGIIEIVLAQDDDTDDPGIEQVRIWEPLLLERGFVLVNSCFNSNSNNRIYVYHLTLNK